MKTSWAKMIQALFLAFLAFSVGCRKNPPPLTASKINFANLPGYYLPTFYWSGDRYKEGKKYPSRVEQQPTHVKEHANLYSMMEHFDEGECRLFLPAIRSQCPLILHVESAKNIDSGVALKLDEKDLAEAVFAHMKCHQLFGRSKGFAGMDRCPLYLRDIRVQASNKISSIELVSDDPAIAKQIRDRIRDHHIPFEEDSQP